MNKQATATFSWDDGHPLDVRVADLFTRYGMLCTFYLPKTNSENLPTMNPSEIRALSRGGFDIHSHTLNHVYLHKLPGARQFSEISEGKKYVEDVTGVEDNIFCYPGGKYTRETVQLVKKAGFKFARTIDMGFTCAYASDNFLMPTTSIIGPMSVTQIAKHSLKRRYLRKAFDIYRINRAILDGTWDEITPATQTFRRCYHFWGHSWELEKYNLWHNLEKLLQSLKSSNTTIVTNKQFYESPVNS